MKKEKRSPGSVIRNALLILLPLLIVAALLHNAGLFKKKKQAEQNRDRTPPSIFLTRDNRYFVEPGGQYEEEGYAAYDETDGDITKKVEVSVNGDLVQYKVQDSAGNITIRFRNIPYERGESAEREESADAPYRPPVAAALAALSGTGSQPQRFPGPPQFL